MRLIKNVNYTLNYIAHTITLLYSTPLDNDDGKHFIVVVTRNILTSESDLTNQVDGTNNKFILDSNFTEDNFIALYYGGQRLVNNFHYTINWTINEITVLITPPLDKHDGKHLISEKALI